MKKTYFCPYGLIKSTVMVCLLSAFLYNGMFGGMAFGFCPEFTASTSANNLTVLAAAPFKTNRIGVEILALTKLYAPPEYSNVTFSKVQSLQDRPSSGWVIPEMCAKETLLDIGGIEGSPCISMAVPADTGCTKVDVWLPNKNITETPDPNDTNANNNVVLDITPPSDLTPEIWSRH